MHRTLFITFIVLVSVNRLFAHGVQIQATFDPASGKIETREIVHTTSRPATIFDLKRVYVIPLLNATVPAGNGWYTRPDDERNIFNVPLFPSGPGLTYQYDDQLAGSGWAYSGSATLPNLSSTNFGLSYADALKQWNGSSFIDPGAEQLQMFRGDATSAFTGSTVNAITSDAGPFANMPLSTISAAGASDNAHSSISFRMLGDGINSTFAPDDGIYLASLQLTSTAGGVNASDPFYFVMYKNQSAADALAAAQALGFPASLIQVLPEPSSLGGLALLGAAFLRRKDRSR